MAEEQLNKRDEFFLRHGKRVYEVREVRVGDVLGIVSPKDIHANLSYVDYLHLTPTFTELNFFPYARLKGPFFGLPISENAELAAGYKFLALDPAKSSGRLWMPMRVSPDLPPERQKEQRDFLESFPDEDERAYVIGDGQYKDLGNLIPLMELPQLNFTPQSTNLEELVEMVKSSVDDIEALRDVSRRLMERFRQHI